MLKFGSTELALHREVAKTCRILNSKGPFKEKIYLTEAKACSKKFTIAINTVKVLFIS